MCNHVLLPSGMPSAGRMFATLWKYGRGSEPPGSRSHAPPDTGAPQASRREEAESLKAAADSLSRLSRQLGAELDRALGAQGGLLGGVGQVQADTAMLGAKAQDYVDRFQELQGKLVRMGFKEEVRLGGEG